MVVHLEVCAGFANRLRALISGLCYAYELNEPLILFWNIDNTCAIDLHECIDVNKIPNFVTVQSGHFEPYKHIYYQSDLDNLPKQIKSYSHFYTKNTDLYNNFLRSIKFKVKPITNKSMIGLHIRRTDHVKCIQQNPLNYFEEYIDNSDKTIYLATDCKETKTYFQKKYGLRIITNDIELTRTNKSGMIGAITDFINLAHCGQIIGSKGSSFSEMASLYGDVSLILSETNV